jgi:hypothetical protein
MFTGGKDSRGLFVMIAGIRFGERVLGLICLWPGCRCSFVGCDLI